MLNKLEHKKLGDVCNYATKKIKINDYSKYISTENLLPNYEGVKFNIEYAETKEGTEYLPNDILISNIRPYLKKIWLSDISGTCSSDVLVLRANNSIISKYLFFNLCNDNFFSYNSSYTKGSKMPRGDKKKIMQYLIPVPAVEEQRRIADILGECDRVIELKQKLINEEEKRKKYLMSVLLSPDSGVRLPGFSEPWKKEKLKDYAIYDSSSISIESIDISENYDYILYDAVGICGKIKTYKMNKEYISIIKDGASVGKVVLCKPFSSVVGTMGYILPKENSNVKFLYYLIERLNLSKYITGSTIPHIYFKEYGNEIIFIPTIEEQKAIADILSCQDSKIELLKKELEEWKTKKKSLMQLLLTGLVRTGEKNE